MLKKLSKNQSGQSLMEMLIAIFILIVALTATIVLIVTSIQAAQESRNKLVATNLSREGIEVVRNIRDGNWIDPVGQDWDQDLDTGNVAIPVIDGTSNITLDFTPVDFTDSLTAVKLLNNDYWQGPLAPGENSLFRRIIYLNPICQDNNIPVSEQIAGKEEVATCGQAGTSVENHPNKVGVRVISEVRWSKAGSYSTSRRVIVEDHLYNWQNL